MDPTGVSRGRPRTDPATTVVPGPEYIPDSANEDQLSFPLTLPTNAGKLAPHQRNPQADSQPVVGSTPMRPSVRKARHEKPTLPGLVGHPDQDPAPEVPSVLKGPPQEAAAESCAAVPPDLAAQRRRLLQILEEADELRRQLAEAGDMEGLESSHSAGRRAAKVHVINGARPALILKMMGSVPSGQKFRAMVGLGDKVGTQPLVIDDDGGSPVSLISPQLAKQLVLLGRARPLLGKALYKDFSGVQSASGHDLGYEGDYELELHPFDESGQPLKSALKVLVHSVSAYKSDGVLIGTQQHHRWELETSYKTGLKSITGEDGRVHSIPFSTREDGAPLIPSAVRVVTPGVPEAIPEAIPWAGEPLDETVAQKPMAETVDKIESLDQPLEDAPA